jgi:hypothetical protein
MQNLEFELYITFNSEKCWALFENLVRFMNYEKLFNGVKTDNEDEEQTDKVLIDDCFR